ATADFQGFELDINIIVSRQQYGICKTYAGEFLTLVEETTTVQSVPDLGISVSQHEMSWISDEGYIVVDWLEELNASTGDPTGKATGMVLQSYSVP
ncbi:MAG: hypothetical protein ABI743_13190, partial [bacterium]